MPKRSLQQHRTHPTPALQSVACACFTALAIAVLAGWWIVTSSTLDSYAAQAYYSANLNNGILPRSLLGTVAQGLSLTQAQFIFMLHGFKMLWLGVLCWQLVKHTAPPAVSIWLCALFGFNFPVWITHHHGGFIDIAVHTWLLLAACLVLPLKDGAPCPWKRLLALFTLALLTHELALFGIAIIMLWITLGQQRREKRLSVATALLCSGFLVLTWKRTVYGYSVGDYTVFLFSPHRISLYGLFTAAGSLWLLYPLAIRSGLHQRRGKARVRYVWFVVFALLLCLLPAMLGGDTQRMACIAWLPLFFMLTERKDALAAQSRLLPLLLILQCAVPPGFTFNTIIHPMNCYAMEALPPLLEAAHSELRVARYVHFRSECNALE